MMFPHVSLNIPHAGQNQFSDFWVIHQSIKPNKNLTRVDRGEDYETMTSLGKKPESLPITAHVRSAVDELSVLETMSA